MSLARILLLSVFASCFSAALYGEYRQHGTHVHGEGELLVVLEDQALDISFRIPAGDLIGFEHAARTPEEEAAIASAKALLRDGDQVFTLTGAPQCELVRSSALFALTTHDHGEEETEGPTDNAAQAQEDEHGQHAEFHVRYKYQCTEPMELEAFVFNIFEHYPAVEKVKTALIISSEQSAATLTASQPEIRIKECRFSIGSWCVF